MLTPYQLIKLLNSLTGFNLPTQMGYNYVRNRLIPSTDGKVSYADAAAWAAKYLAKKDRVFFAVGTTV